MAKGKAKETKAKDTDAETPKYGMAELEKETGLTQVALRVKLRKSEFEKNGSRWGWDTKKEFDAVVKAMKAESPKSEKPAKEKSPKAKAAKGKTKRSSKKAA